MLGKLDITCRRWKVDPYLSPCTRINSKHVSELIIRLETTRGKHRENASRYRQGNDFLSWIPIIQKVRARIAKWDCVKL
jgi:hypothetical protein